MSIKIRFHNRANNSCTFSLEPWGDSYEMKSGASYELLAHGPSDSGNLEIRHSERAITVYAWSGAVLSLFEGNLELGEGKRAREPCP